MWSRVAGANANGKTSVMRWFCFLCKHEWCEEPSKIADVDKPAREIPQTTVHS